MPNDLYETLQVTRDAGPEEIRKAYKKRALQTHPDRLPPNSTPAEKASAEEQFRKVNNAYEILKDTQKRQAYDIHGVWPPPREDVRPASSHYDHSRHHRRHHSYSRHSDPFFTFPDFHFTDPFELFDSIFHNPQRHHSRHRGFRHHPLYRDDDFAFPNVGRSHSEIDDFMFNMERNMLSMSSPFGGMGMRSRFPSSFPTIVMDTGSGFGGGDGRWTSESTISQTVNGVTYTTHKRRDWEGNEHVTRIYPDGHKVVTINGVEQHDQGRIPPPPPPPTNNYLPSGPPPPYSASPGPGAKYGGPSEAPVIPNYRNATPYNNEDTIPSPTHASPSKKRWWSR
ncbi:hypothetical protein GYMLUDRAFT_42618 [Collybiopsis luxurians FD-317 M1]|uniref:J domain-containing protein n=1 Tax=Collybiopsis luxurians FD-317 M1 TaxID=944289 RepID=A0A0D0C081_9AGAR|nr:hypothetical protein GYMLUDRAFT_42618 [Collybiopsis luxurians FD-317 M1]